MKKYLKIKKYEDGGEMTTNEGKKQRRRDDGR